MTKKPSIETAEELRKIVAKIFPDGCVDIDNYRHIIIYTGLIEKRTKPGYLRRFTKEDDKLYKKLDEWDEMKWSKL